jgi:16S rRNA (guanine527-N7)-methyltransferase
VEPARIAELLQPYLAQAVPASGGHAQTSLSQHQLNNILTYVDILLRWNARINLTAVREPEEIVRRHFGESLFTARHLFPNVDNQPAIKIIDVGSGAGFPGLPLKLWLPQAHVALIESNHKKVAFLREVIRSLTLTNINVFAGRAQDYAKATGDVVTLRAVEKFESTLPTVVDLVSPGGRLALLIGEGQCQQAMNFEPSLYWSEPISFPGSTNRVLLIAHKNQELNESSQ